MRRPTRTKLRILNVRHPGMEDKVNAMFSEFWPVRLIRHIISSQYGERLSTSTLDRERRRHWRARREMVMAVAAALARPEC